MWLSFEQEDEKKKFDPQKKKKKREKNHYPRAWPSSEAQCLEQLIVSKPQGSN